MPQLIRPDPRLQTAFLDALAESREEDAEADHWFGLASSAAGRTRWQREDLESTDAFASFVADQLRDVEEDAPRPAGYVPATLLWWVAGDRWLGRLSLRHRLTPFLRDIGGHVGYFVRPSARRRGHATAMLRESLPWAYDLGIDPVLVTCDDDNVASRRVIEANGGVLEDQRERKLRYWVPTRRLEPADGTFGAYGSRGGR